jgi:threonyl-tRNA synthetase
MQLLVVHADHLEFEAVTAVEEDLAETEGVPMEGRMEDCVAVFVTVEREDEADLDAAVGNAASELRDVADQLNTRKVVLYPYAHLSDDLAAPDSATVVLRNLQTDLDADFEVLRAPFGWYKAFELSSKGHPLSELSRHVTPERGERADADAESTERVPSKWKLTFPDGVTRAPIEAKEDDRVSDDLRALIENEVEDDTVSASEEPSHAELMQEQELADYDDRSDAGNLRWYPRGKLVRDSLVEYLDNLVVGYGGLPVETPAASDFDSRAGPFSIMRDAHLAAENLPFRIYESESAPRSSRREPREGVSGLARQRAFAVPEMHTATRDVKRAKDELREQAKLARQTGEDLGLDYVSAVRLTREFYDANEAWVESLVSDLGAPALLEILPEDGHDWSVEIAFATIDGLGRPIEIGAVRLDLESAERFDVEYSISGNTDENGDEDEETHHPPILHWSPFGSTEGVLTALLERAAKQETPRLPTWLSPTQVRFVPVGEDHVDHCDALATDLEAADIRADVDDRDETVGERIARAESDWVPYYVVIGDRELEPDENVLKVTVRGEDEEREMSIEELQETVLGDVGDLPKKPRYLPKRVSKHPRFTVR